MEAFCKPRKNYKAYNETPTTIGIIMSSSVKSILTSAMENANAKINGDSTEEKTNLPVSDEVAAKRLIKRAGIAFLGTVAVVTAVVVTVNKLSKDENAEDIETTEV